MVTMTEPTMDDLRANPRVYRKALAWDHANDGCKVRRAPTNMALILAARALRVLDDPYKEAT